MTEIYLHFLCAHYLAAGNILPALGCAAVNCAALCTERVVVTGAGLACNSNITSSQTEQRQEQHAHVHRRNKCCHCYAHRWHQAICIHWLVPMSTVCFHIIRNLETMHD